MVLLDLAKSGYFSFPKTIGDVQEHAEQTLGYRYKTNELSPTLIRLLRDKVLNRMKRDDGQYQYISV